MVDRVSIVKLDEVYLKIQAAPHILMECSDHFTFDVPGAKFMPAYKNRYWDGKIRLVNLALGTLYIGLLEELVTFLEKRDYEVTVDMELSQTEFSVKEALDFIRTLDLPENKTPRDYQVDSFVHCVRSGRLLLLSPTASGKSLIIYILMRYYLEVYEARTLIIVPTVSLVHQMNSDFADYYCPFMESIHKIYSGKEKLTDHPVTITTWQSIQNMDKKFFEGFDLIICDEAHGAKAKVLTKIMTSTTHARFKFGTTGTLDGVETNEMVLRGLFGPIRNVTTSAELMEQGHIAELKIKALVLKYSKSLATKIQNMTYQEEIDYIVQIPERNNFIKNLALSLDGNVLILFNFKDKHGKVLHSIIKEEAGPRKVYYIDGGVSGDEREHIRHIVMKESNSLIVASFGTLSTGTNIPNLNYIIFASPSKSRIRNLQSIGRGLRLSEGKKDAVLFDIADDFSGDNKKHNYTLLHFIERIKIYISEKFKYKIYRINLKVKEDGK